MDHKKILLAILVYFFAFMGLLTFGIGTTIAGAYLGFKKGRQGVELATKAGFQEGTKAGAVAAINMFEGLCQKGEAFYLNSAKDAAYICTPKQFGKIK